MLRTVFSTLFLIAVAPTLCVATARFESRTEAVSPLPSKVQFRSSAEVDSIRQSLKRSVHGILVPRQATPPQTLDLVQWERETSAKCAEKLKTLRGKASNPAGIAICYNIPFADQKSGVFGADLRLYQVANPSAAWATVGDDIGLSLQYEVAVVAESNFNQNVTLTKSPPGAPDLVRVFNFLGLVKTEFLKPNQDFKRLLIPLVTLKGRKKDKSGEIVETQLATNEASFVNGQFISDVANSSAPAAAEVKPFELPGKAIAIMPIGLIVYSVWMVIGVSIVMYGTFERRKFRDHYRKRIAGTQPGNARI